MTGTISKIAEALFGSTCLKFGQFKIKSGALSPYYIDLAGLLSSPRDLCSIAEVAADEIRRITTVEKIDRLASIELRGALLLPSIACKAGLPCVVVRKESKAYGVTGRIVGKTVKDENVLFFDDVVSEGLSKLEGIKPLQELGVKVKHIMVIVNREQGGKENLERLGFRVHALANISDLVNSLQQSGHISAEQTEVVLKYINKT